MDKKKKYEERCSRFKYDNERKRLLYKPFRKLKEGKRRCPYTRYGEGERIIPFIKFDENNNPINPYRDTFQSNVEVSAVEAEETNKNKIEMENQNPLQPAEDVQAAISEAFGENNYVNYSVNTGDIPSDRNTGLVVDPYEQSFYNRESASNRMGGSISMAPNYNTSIPFLAPNSGYSAWNNTNYGWPIYPTDNVAYTNVPVFNYGGAYTGYGFNNGYGEFIPAVGNYSGGDSGNPPTSYVADVNDYREDYLQENLIKCQLELVKKSNRKNQDKFFCNGIVRSCVSIVDISDGRPIAWCYQVENKSGGKNVLVTVDIKDDRERLRIFKEKCHFTFTSEINEKRSAELFADYLLEKQHNALCMEYCSQTDWYKNGNTLSYRKRSISLEEISNELSKVTSEAEMQELGKKIRGEYAVSVSPQRLNLWNENYQEYFKIMSQMDEEQRVVIAAFQHYSAIASLIDRIAPKHVCRKFLVISGCSRSILIRSLFPADGADINRGMDLKRKKVDFAAELELVKNEATVIQDVTGETDYKTNSLKHKINYVLDCFLNQEHLRSVMVAITNNKVEDFDSESCYRCSFEAISNFNQDYGRIAKIVRTQLNYFAEFISTDVNIIQTVFGKYCSDGEGDHQKSFFQAMLDLINRYVTALGVNVPETLWEMKKLDKMVDSYLMHNECYDLKEDLALIFGERLNKAIADGEKIQYLEKGVVDNTFLEEGKIPVFYDADHIFIIKENLKVLLNVLHMDVENRSMVDALSYGGFLDIKGVRATDKTRRLNVLKVSRTYVYSIYKKVLNNVDEEMK